MNSASEEQILSAIELPLDSDAFLSGFTALYWKKEGVLPNLSIVDLIDPFAKVCASFQFLQAADGYELYQSSLEECLIRRFQSIDQYENYLLQRPFEGQSLSCSLRLKREFFDPKSEAAHFRLLRSNWDFCDFREFISYCLERKQLPSKKISKEQATHLPKISLDWFYEIFDCRKLESFRYFCFVLQELVEMDIVDRELKDWLEPTIPTLFYLEQHLQDLMNELSQTDSIEFTLFSSMPWSHWSALFLISCDCSSLELEEDEIYLLSKMKADLQWWDQEFRTVKISDLQIRAWIEEFGRFSWFSLVYVAVMYCIRFDLERSEGILVMRRCNEILNQIESHGLALKRYFEKLGKWDELNQQKQILQEALLLRLEGKLLTIGQCKSWWESKRTS